MTTHSRDPLLRGLDELADLADGLPAVDRMAGISRKARVHRYRRAGTGVAGLAVVAAGTLGVLQLAAGDGGTEPGVATDGGTDASAAPGGLSVDLEVDAPDSRRLALTYRIHGAATAWTTAGEVSDFAGPAYTAVLVDGEELGGTDGGQMDCRAGAPELAFDETWSGMEVPVPGPGTYTVTVQAPYCGPEGKIVPTEVTQEVTVR